MSEKEKERKLTCKEILDFQKDEHKASIEYSEFKDKKIKSFAKDEKRHAKYFDELAEKCK